MNFWLAQQWFQVVTYIMWQIERITLERPALKILKFHSPFHGLLLFAAVNNKVNHVWQWNDIIQLDFWLVRHDTILQILLDLDWNPDQPMIGPRQAALYR